MDQYAIHSGRLARNDVQAVALSDFDGDGKAAPKEPEGADLQTVY
jgi:hypothetical protein